MIIFNLIEYTIILFLLLTYYMHMFQLNSYIGKIHISWLKKNYIKTISQIIIITISSTLENFNNIITLIISAILFAFSIWYVIPKQKYKVTLKITSRVIRLFITELIILVLIIIVKDIKSFMIIKFTIINITLPILCVIANYINLPIEHLIKKIYTKKAIKILENMPNLTVIGVTGTYGKTSVKNFLEKTLSTKYEVITTPKNYNTPMGIVKTIRNELKPYHNIFICEMGATKIGDIEEICRIVKPKIGVITAIGPQHLDSFKSIDNIIKTKFELSEYLKKNNGIVFLNYDNEFISNYKKESHVITFGTNNSNLDFNAYNINSSSKGIEFNISNVKYKSKLIGKHNAVNLTCAISISIFLKIPLNTLVSRIKEIENIEHRLNVISRGNITILDDSYNSNPISSISALDTLLEFKTIRIIVTPGLVELGNDTDKYNYSFGKNISKTCDFVFLVGKSNSKALYDGITSQNFDKKNIFFIKTPTEAMQKITTMFNDKKVTVLLENDLPDNYN